jgi:hypothetical protein
MNLYQPNEDSCMVECGLRCLCLVVSSKGQVKSRSVPTSNTILMARLSSSLSTDSFLNSRFEVDSVA